jgi:hypothetical protein
VDLVYDVEDFQRMLTYLPNLTSFKSENEPAEDSIMIVQIAQFYKSNLLELEILEDSTESCLSILAKLCPNLTLFKNSALRNHSMPGVLKLIDGCSKLIDVSFGQHVTDDIICHLIDKCKQLRRLNMECSLQITDVTISKLNENKELEYVGLYGCHEISELALISFFRSHPKLIAITSPSNISSIYCIHSLYTLCLKLRNVYMENIECYGLIRMIEKLDLEMFHYCSDSINNDCSREFGTNWTVAITEKTSRNKLKTLQISGGEFVNVTNGFFFVLLTYSPNLLVLNLDCEIKLFNDTTIESICNLCPRLHSFSIINDCGATADGLLLIANRYKN